MSLIKNNMISQISHSSVIVTYNDISLACLVKKLDIFVVLLIFEASTCFTDDVANPKRLLERSATQSNTLLLPSTLGVVHVVVEISVFML